MRSSRSEARPALDGTRDGLTLVLAYAPFGLALGAALTSTRVDPLLAWSSSLIVFAGGAQLVSVQLLADGASSAVVVSTALVMNSRHLLYSASLAPHVQGWSQPSRGLAAYFLADPVYALAIGRFEDQDPHETHRSPQSRWRYYLSMALVVWAGWALLTGCGSVVAAALPNALSLEIAAPLTFLLLLLPSLRSRAGYAAAGVAGLVATVAAELPLGLGLLAGACTGIAVANAFEGSRRA